MRIRGLVLLLLTLISSFELPAGDIEVEDSGFGAVTGSRVEHDATAERSLRFEHTHRIDSIEVVYYRNGEYVTEGLEQLNHYLRDWRTHEEIEFDPALFDFLWQLNQATGTKEPFAVISSYRSPATNEKLRAKSSGVAKKSQHVLGKAIDIRLADVDSKTLRDLAIELKLGGVGYYASSDFVHIDTGRVRRW